MNNFSILLPYFVHNNNNYQSFISPGIITENGQYKDIYEDTLSQNGWEKIGMFFGINPSYKPIPNEMQMFKITLNNTFLQDIKDISLHYDIYNVSNNYIYFITYTKPVLNTTPLYIWENNHNHSTWVSFSPKPPKQKGWKPNLINPIYVIDPKIVGVDIYNIKFLCNDGVSMPVIPNQPENPDIYNPTKHIEPKVLHKSIVDCAQLIDHNNNSQTLVANVQGYTPPITNNSILYIVAIIIFIIFIFGGIYFIIHKPKL